MAKEKPRTRVWRAGLLTVFSPISGRGVQARLSIGGSVCRVVIIMPQPGLRQDGGWMIFL
ncbi:exported hypothetical protein [Magnetospirillum molischianum DSM 120]|uniref:Uncharacterized protein n=1 Tax=Magnetospirillum molischianum DSM 120 TaxID=1150626 RepID=H8FQN0_MAGML|nr:exported hypothetical protein [Magnetospirillum molischianum DSM 120]